MARAVLFVAVDPDHEEQRLLSQVKHNLGRLDLPTLLFDIRGSLVETTADGDEVWTAKLVWRGESDRSLREVLERVTEHEEDRIAVREAEDWLVDYLTSQGGTAAAQTVIELGRKASHSRRTLYRARQHAGVQSDARGFPRVAYWLLPPATGATTTDGAGTAGTTRDVGTTGAHSRQSDPVMPVVSRAGDVTTTGTPADPSPGLVVPPEAGPVAHGTTGTTEADPFADESDDC